MEGSGPRVGWEVFPFLQTDSAGYPERPLGLKKAFAVKGHGGVQAKAQMWGWAGKGQGLQAAGVEAWETLLRVGSESFGAGVGIPGFA